MKVTPVSDAGHALVEWWADFDCAPDERGHWKGFFAGEVFAPALGGLREYFG